MYIYVIRQKYSRIPVSNKADANRIPVGKAADLTCRFQSRLSYIIPNFFM